MHMSYPQLLPFLAAVGAMIPALQTPLRMDRFWLILLILASQIGRSTRAQSPIAPRETITTARGGIMNLCVVPMQLAVRLTSLTSLSHLSMMSGIESFLPKVHAPDQDLKVVLVVILVPLGLVSDCISGVRYPNR